MIIGTDMRTGELLALKWDAVNLTERLVTIRRTVGQDRNERFFVQEFTKTDAGYRELELPAEVVEMLLRRRVDSHSEFVFPSAVNALRLPPNYGTSWRAALAGTPYAGVTPKSFRKTVATVVRDELGTDAAKEQLGHEDKKTTEAHYADQVHRGPASATVLSKLYA